jgi:TolB-like protein
MTPETWVRVKATVQQALEQAPEARAAFVAAACAGDSNLRGEVESLLAAHQRAGTFIDAPLSPAAAAQIVGALEQVAHKLQRGDRLGPYEVLGVLGAGGMGEVYRARDLKLGRDIAIKVLAPGVAHDPDRLQRFEREARAVAALNHPHIVTIFSTEEAGGVRFITMELVEGRTLARLIPTGGVSLAQFFDIAVALADALAAAHRRQVTHRDLKPANVMVSDDGRVKVLDFGLARSADPEVGSVPVDETRRTLTQPGTILGTLPYMSPEQIEAKALDPRTDIFSLGIMLYEMATGARPFAGDSTPALMAAILKDHPTPAMQRRLDVPGGVSDLIDRCLEKHPPDRIQTTTEILTELKAQRRAWESRAQPAERAASIAVLPFANMSADKENEYFGDGLAEEIINVLAQLPGMKVAARTSSFFFRGKDVEFGEIGKRLNVEHILEGSVRKAGNRIRVTAQLIKVADGFHLWSERYDREMTDIFAIQDEITQAIAAVLRIKLSAGPAALPRRTPDLRAYEAYLSARHECFSSTPEALARTKAFVDRAIALDPEFALAHSLLGLHYSIAAAVGITPARDVIPLARAAEQEALRIEPLLPEAHALLGCWAGTYDFDWSEAERQWRLAMAGERVSHDIRVWYGNHFLLPIGRPAEAVTAMAAGLQEDPLNLLYRHHLAVGLRHAGRLEDAAAELRKVLELNESFPFALGTLGAVCAQQERFDDALALTERAHACSPWSNPIVGQLAALLIRAGERDRARKLIATLGTGEAYGAPTGLAVFHALCGEFDRAAQWAERAIDERFPPLVAILRPLLQSSARWRDLAKLMNLPGETIS